MIRGAKNNENTENLLDEFLTGKRTTERRRERERETDTEKKRNVIDLIEKKEMNNGRCRMSREK